MFKSKNGKIQNIEKYNNKKCKEKNNINDENLKIKIKRDMKKKTNK
jgi:hypothetical protein